MSFCLCAISNKIPLYPVFSPTTNLVYDKTILTSSKYFNEEGKILCPVTNKIISPLELIDIKASKPSLPRTTKTTDVSEIFKQLISEYNNLQLEKNTVTEELEEKKQELSYSLYRNEASVRVITRLNKEKDELKNKLLQLQHAYEDIQNNIEEINKEVESSDTGKERM